MLALSSASGTAPFDAALRRYVEFLTADGELDVEVDIDPDVRLAPDEQIEVFRIVQEGLANARRHAGARAPTSRSARAQAGASSASPTTARGSTVRSGQPVRGSATCVSAPSRSTAVSH